MNITKLDAAKRQLATAIHLYFGDVDAVSVHTLVMAAGEIIDQLCKSKGLPTLREHFLAMIIPKRRKEFRDRLNKARNFFKHIIKDPDEILEDFSDEQNLIGILMAADGLRLLGVEMLEVLVFKVWVSVAEPGLMLAPEEGGWVAPLLTAFGLDDIRNEPRAAQKGYGRGLLLLARKGKFPGTPSPSRTTENPLRAGDF
jgi:hypothetical protein